MKRTLMRVALATTCFLSGSAFAAPALKNFREIYESLLIATNVFPNATVTAAYNSTRTRLPIAGEFTELSSTTLTALGALGGVVCREFLTNEENKNPSQRLVHKAVDFSLPPAQISADVVSDVHTQFIEMFWGRMPSQAELAEFQTQYTKASGVSGAKTKDAFFLSCVTATTSLDFLLMR